VRNLNTSSWLKRYGVFLSKRWGQHFLSNEAIAKKIAGYAKIQPDEQVIEIGPGAGGLTHYLLKEARQVVAIEIDPRLSPLLEERFGSNPSFILRRADFLTIPHQEMNLTTPFLFVSNLPYNVGVAMLQRVWSDFMSMDRAIFMLQKEVVERLTSPPSKKAYGSLSVFCQSLVDLQILCAVSPSHFIPNPRVESVVIEMKPKKQSKLSPEDHGSFSSFLRTAFAHRRKMLKSALTSNPKMLDAMKACGIDASQRAESLSVDDFHCLYQHWKGGMI